MDTQREQRIRAAWAYYVEGNTQADVARILGLSRIAVTRLLSEARRRGEVTIAVDSDLAPLVATARALERRFDLARAIVAPCPGDGDPIDVIAAAAGPYVSGLLGPGATVGVGWGRTLHAMLAHLRRRPVEGMRVVSLLGGIAQAKRFNPAEFAWRFAEAFEAEGFLIPAPALVDSPQTRHALLERCGLDQVFQLAEASDVAILSCGGLSGLTTSYRLGHLTEAERDGLARAGAVGDILYNFVDATGAVVDHSVNSRAVSMSLERLQRISRRVLVSGGAGKLDAVRAAILCLRPTALVTDERTARALLDAPPGGAA